MQFILGFFYSSVFLFKSYFKTINAQFIRSIDRFTHLRCPADILLTLRRIELRDQARRILLIVLIVWARKS